MVAPISAMADQPALVRIHTDIPIVMFAANTGAWSPGVVPKEVRALGHRTDQPDRHSQDHHAHDHGQNHLEEVLSKYPSWGTTPAARCDGNVVVIVTILHPSEVASTIGAMPITVFGNPLASRVEAKVPYPVNYRRPPLARRTDHRPSAPEGRTQHSTPPTRRLTEASFASDHPRRSGRRSPSTPHRDYSIRVQRLTAGDCTVRRGQGLWLGCHRTAQVVVGVAPGLHHRADGPGHMTARSIATGCVGGCCTAVGRLAAAADDEHPLYDSPLVRLGRRRRGGAGRWTAATWRTCRRPCTT